MHGAYVMTNRNGENEEQYTQTDKKTHEQQKQYDTRRMLVTLKINTRVALTTGFFICMLLPYFVSIFFLLICVIPMGIYGATVWPYILETHISYGDMCSFFIRSSQSQP